MTNDITSATIDGAENVTVGKDNRQQTGGYGDQHVTVNAHDEGEIGTIRLIYELVSRLENNLAREGREWRAAFDSIRHDIAEVSRVAHETKARVDDINNGMAQAVILNQTHRRTFLAGFALLTLPVPLYFDGLLRVADINWPLALTMALACYVLSAGFWHYMWWGR